MIPTPITSQQGSSGLNSLSETDGSSPSPGYAKIWEGDLCGLTEGPNFFICKLQGYRSVVASKPVVADWPPVMQIARVMPQVWLQAMKIVRVNRKYFGKAFFRMLSGHCFLAKLQEMKLCGVIFLPSQIMVLFVFDGEGVGLFFPKDMVLRIPREYDAGPLNCECDSNCDCEPCDYNCGCNCSIATMTVDMSCYSNNCSSSRNCNINSSSCSYCNCNINSSHFDDYVYLYPWYRFTLTCPEKNCDVNNIRNQTATSTTATATTTAATATATSTTDL